MHWPQDLFARDTQRGDSGPGCETYDPSSSLLCAICSPAIDPTLAVILVASVNNGVCTIILLFSHAAGQLMVRYSTSVRRHCTLHPSHNLSSQYPVYCIRVALSITRRNITASAGVTLYLRQASRRCVWRSHSFGEAACPKVARSPVFASQDPY
jgi:hypothetical protein